ncbi:MAG: DUF262 domain-containing protein [Anaerolineales bacterium]
MDKEEEVEQLWLDIIQAMDENRSEYFLGTIVVDEDREEKIRTVIDGQQRLATLSMIFSAIRTVYEDIVMKDLEKYIKIISAFVIRRTRLTEARLCIKCAK